MKKSLLLFAALAVCGCNTDLWAQPRTKPLENSDFFQDQSSARPLPPGTVAITQEIADDGFLSGSVNGKPIDKVPVAHAIRELHLNDLHDLMERGQERFNVFCSPCHGRLGDGKGMIAQRGLALVKQPANFHDPRLVNAPDGHFFQVMTNGYGHMFSYRSRVPVADRWAIVSYIRALELSEGAKL